MDSEQTLIRLIDAMRPEVRKLELDNMGLRSRAGAGLRKSATPPIVAAECRGGLMHYRWGCVLLNDAVEAEDCVLISPETH